MAGKTHYDEVMGIKFSCEQRTYYFDLKRDAHGAHFLSISEVDRHTGERHRVIVSDGCLPEFQRSVKAVTDFLQTGELPKRTLAERRKDHPRAYEPWNADEDDRLRAAYESGQTAEQLATTHQRKPSAITSRLRRLGVIK